MNLRTFVALVSGAAVVLVMMAGDAVPARAQGGTSGPTKVTKLRVENVALYDRPNGKKIRDYPRAQFAQPWPIVATDPSGFVQVKVDGERYWVRGYAVETDLPFRVDSDCKAVVASRQPKAGVTRGIGEECK